MHIRHDPDFAALDKLLVKHMLYLRYGTLLNIFRKHLCNVMFSFKFYHYFLLSFDYVVGKGVSGKLLMIPANALAP
jgi:hypothetical protein